MILVDLTKMSSGYCDKLRCLTFGIATLNLAYKNKNKIINLIEKKNKECPYNIEDICKISNFTIIKKKFNKKIYKTISMSPYDSSINIENVRKHNLFTNIPEYRLLNEWKRSYQLLVPSKKVTLALKKNNLPKNFFSVHIRASDKVLSPLKKIFEIPYKQAITQSQIDFFIKNIISISNKFTISKNVFIASDVENIKFKVIKIFQEHNFKVFSNEMVFRNNFYRKTSAIDFGADLFCLKKSSLIISSTGGGVPETANLISGKNKHINFLKDTSYYDYLNFFSKIIYFLRKLK
jgi:hypothetical protein